LTTLFCPAFFEKKESNELRKVCHNKFETQGPEAGLSEYKKHFHLEMPILSPRNLRWHLGVHSGTSKERLLWRLILSEITTSSGVSNREDQRGSLLNITYLNLLGPTGGLSHSSC